MATTIVPKYTEPIVVTTEEIREAVQSWLEHNRGDEGKASDIEDAIYWGGCADAFEHLLQWMTGVHAKEEDKKGE